MTDETTPTGEQMSGFEGNLQMGLHLFRLGLTTDHDTEATYRRLFEATLTVDDLLEQMAHLHLLVHMASAMVDTYKAVLADRFGVRVNSVDAIAVAPGVSLDATLRDRTAQMELGKAGLTREVGGE